MDVYERILVAFLSSALGIFLVLGCIALVKIVQILHSLKRIAEKAEKLTDKAEIIGEFFERARAPLNLAKLFGNVIEAVAKHAKKHKEE